MADLQVRKLHPGFGAEIAGLRPEIPLDDDTCRQLRELFDERGLLVFRDIDIDEAFQRYLAHMLIGQELPAEPAPGKSPDGGTRRKPMFISNKESGGAAPYGSPRSTTASTTLNTAVALPMARANVSTATRLNAGARRSARSASRRS